MFIDLIRIIEKVKGASKISRNARRAASS